MNNLKKLLAVVIVVAMMVTVMIPAFAAEAYSYSAEAQVLNDLGLYKGISDTTFDPDLGTALDRETGVVMLLRIFGLEDQALAISDSDSVLAKFSDASSIAAWAKKDVAYAVENGLVLGLPDGTFGPAVALNGKAYATLILRQLGFTPDYANAPAELAEKGGLNPTEAVKFTDKNLVKDDLVGISYGALKATDKDGKTVIDSLVAAGVVTEEAATDAGLTTPAATPAPTVAPVTDLDIDTASAINSKVIEIDLNTAVTAVDASVVAIKDAAGKSIAVTSAALAGYDTDNKTVLVTLEANTVAGTLYTLTSGTKSVNFGGKAADTTKPEVATNGVAATDANEVTVTFTEPVVLDGATITLAAKYGTKAAVAVSNLKYGASDQIVLTVGDMKDATLYGIAVSGVKDFAGNVIDSIDTNTFVGKGKPTDALKLAAVRAGDYNEVVVKFNVNVDPASLVPANFAIAAKYGTKAAVAVTAVTVGKDGDDSEIAGTTIDGDSAGRPYAILTVDGTMKDATLYGLTVSNLKTLYGVAQSTDSADDSLTFVGKAKPTGALEFGTTAATATSNTEITVSFANKVDQAAAESIANYAIVEAYGAKTALTITKAVLQDNDTDVKLTVAAMKNLLYKLTVTSIKDIYGNAIKTDDSYNTVSFAGKAVGKAIDNIDSVNRTDAAITDVDTQICVAFNYPVGATATDVAHYTIDNGIGYPAKAAKVDGAGNEKKVILTVGKTTAGQIYKLTVKGLENSDGVAMGADGVSKTFVGQGDAAGLPEIQAVMASDDHTIKVYFDRAVDGNMIKGKIYNADTNKLIASRLSYKVHTAANYIDLITLGAYVYKDTEDANVLVIRDDATSFEANTYDFKANATYVNSDDDANILQFAGNTTDAANPEIISVASTDKNTVLVYFSEPVKDITGTPFTIKTKEDGTGDTIVVTSFVKVDSMTYKLKVGNLANATYYLRVAETSGNDNDTTIDKITDVSGFMELTSTTDSTSSADYAAIQFAGTNSAPADIADIDVMMTDTNTIEVYFPEAMNGGDASEPSNASAIANYKLYSDNGTTALAAKYQPVAAVYDSDNNKATLTLYTALAANTTYYLGISDAISNQAKVQNIKTDVAVAGLGHGVSVQFASSSADVTKPSITSVEISSDNTRATVTFDIPVAFGNPTNAAYRTGANGINVGEFAVDGADGVFTAPITFATYFTLAAKDVDNTDVTAPLAANRIDNKTIELVFSKPLKAGTQGTLTVKAAQVAADTIFTLSRTAVDSDADDVQEVDFGVVAAQADTTAPVKAVAVTTSDVAATTAKIHVTYNEAGTVYYIVVADGSTAPTADEVIAGVNYTNAPSPLATVVTAGHGAVAAATDTAVNISGLTTATAYTVYVVSTDTDSNVSDIDTVNFTTL